MDGRIELTRGILTPGVRQVCQWHVYFGADGTLTASGTSTGSRAGATGTIC